jgi:FkbM family methyltransferase
MSLLRRTVRRALRALGYELHPISDRHLYHVNDFADMRFILNHVAAPVIVDGGANHGRTVDHFLALFPNATVFAIEANPELVQKLRDKYQNDGRVTVVGQAVSDRNGTVQFHVSNDATQGMSSMLPWRPESENTRRVERRIEAETVRLDSLCHEHGLEVIDILKLDIQGAELVALAGAGDFLHRGAIKAIYLEVWFDHEEYQGQCHFIDVYQLMKQNGYVMYGIYNTTQPEYTPNQPLIAADAIFIHSSLAASLDTALTEVVHNRKRTALNRTG